MISCFAHNGMQSQSISTFFDMLEFGEYPNQFCLAAVIQACSNSKNAWIGKIIFEFVIKTGYFESDLGQPKDAIELFIDMVASGFIPDRFTFSSTISAFSELELLSLGQQLHSLVVKSRLTLDVCVGCSLVDIYVKCAVDGSMVNSRKVFDQMPDHNVLSWTATITGYVQSGGHDKEAIELYCRMIEGQVVPSHLTFSSLLKACGNLSDPAAGEQIYTNAVKHGLPSVNCVGNSLISMYARPGRMEDARKAFDILFEKNLVSYSTIVDDGYAKNWIPMKPLNSSMKLRIRELRLMLSHTLVS
ncbi:hypothetical protein CsSME_00001700 [Camellia sinensis var. sinensis]